MRYLFIVLFLLAPTLGCGQEMGAISEIRAKDVAYDSRQIQLIGEVFIDHQFGTIVCDKATIQLAPSKDATAKNIMPEKIFLSGHVQAKLKDGSELSSEEAEIDCSTLEGYFRSKAPNKVVYTMVVVEGDTKAPIKTTCEAMRAKMKKTEHGEGYVFSEVKGEGSVVIEYQPQKSEASGERE
jgi:hypothetical protein